MSKFDEWWSGETNPALNMPESTQIQIKGFLRAAFQSGYAAAITERAKKRATPGPTDAEAHVSVPSRAACPCHVARYQ